MCMWNMSSLPTVTPSTSTSVADNNDDDDDNVIVFVELNITALHAAA